MRRIKNFKFLSVKTMTLIIVICFTVFSGAIITYQALIEKTKSTKEEIVNIVAEKSYDEILLYYNSLKKQSILESQNAANSIRDDIIHEYGNMYVLKEELDKNTYSEKLVSIFKRNIQDVFLNNIESIDNSLIVADYNGIILDYRYSISNDKIKRSWQEEKQNHYNKKLYDDSITKIIEQQTEGFIVQQRKDDKKETLYEEFTIDTFKEIYYNEGIKGFKNLTFLVPTYIYDREDLFGDSDIVDGIKTKNHKLIVIQQFNLYDQVSFLSDSVIKNDHQKETIEKYDDILNTLYILGIVILTAVIGLVFILCILYNYVMMELRRKEQDKK